MKRLILVMLVLGLVGYASHKSGVCPIRRHFHDVHIHDAYFISGPLGSQAVRAEYEAARQAKQDADDARREALEAIEEARRDVDEATREAALDVRESVDGIPVPIVSGTRVADASPTAPRPPARPRPPKRHRSVLVASGPNAPAQIQVRKVAGRISATNERAKADARRQLREDVDAWLEPYVPSPWRTTERQIDAMVVGTRITPVEKPYATLYIAELDADFSDARRAELVHWHQQLVVRHRMLELAGLLGFALACLAAVSGYIRTDEATKGYYTNRLRVLAAAGVGAVGAVIYQMIT